MPQQQTPEGFVTSDGRLVYSVTTTLDCSPPNSDAGLSRSKDYVKRWQFMTRDLLFAMTGVAVSISLYRIQGYAILLSAICLGGTVGNLIGRIWNGASESCVLGFWIGSIVAVLLLWALLPTHPFF